MHRVGIREQMLFEKHDHQGTSLEALYTSYHIESCDIQPQLYGGICRLVALHVVRGSRTEFFDCLYCCARDALDC